MYTELKKLPVPGFAWFAILVLLVGGLHTFAENAFYYDAAILLLAGVAKALDVKFEKVIAVVEEFSGDIAEYAGATRRDVERQMQPGLATRGVVPLMRADVVAEVRPGATAKVLRWLVG